VEIKEKFIGRNGVHYAFQMTLVVWVSRNCINSMMQCWQSKCGDCLKIRLLSSISFSKQIFFPNWTIFYAKEDKGSFAWRSILKGREVIKKGAQWRVGNGENILIYKDRWLPDP